MIKLLGSGQVILHCGQSQTVLKNYPDNYFHSVVTDPPYHLTSIVKRFGKENSASAQFGKDGAFGRVSKGFMGKEWDGGDIAFQPEFWAEVYRVLKPGGYLLSFAAPRNYHRMGVAIEDVGFEIRDCLQWIFGSGFPKNHAQSGEWEGWGSALKPAYEPICMARKPLIGSIAQNLAEWGVGAINIDGCRVATDEDITTHSRGKGYEGQSMGRMNPMPTRKQPGQELGRFPANILHDGLPNEWSKFFYCAKTSKVDREEGLDDFQSKMMGFSGGAQSHGEGYDAVQTDALPRVIERKNTHPTVKPHDLMRYLCRLVTPPKGIILDPFMGSGSTGKAAVAEGFCFVGIDMTEEYFEISEARISAKLP